jgi:hypothetical protein
LPNLSIASRQMFQSGPHLERMHSEGRAVRPRARAQPRHCARSPLPRGRGTSTAQIAERLAAHRRRSSPTSTTPPGEKARAVKARYVGVRRGCGAYTQPRNCKGDAYARFERGDGSLHDEAKRVAQVSGPSDASTPNPCLLSEADAGEGCRYIAHRSDFTCRRHRC